MNDKIKEFQEKLNNNMNKVVKLAETNTVRNENGEVVFTKMKQMIWKILRNKNKLINNTLEK